MAYMLGSQDNLLESVSSPMWVPGVELRLSALRTIAYATEPSHHPESCLWAEIIRLRSGSKAC